MENIFFEGILVSGLGEGAFFMSMQHYKEEIKKKLGFDAYPGTLNVKIKTEKSGLLKKSKPINIEGFVKDNETFGAVHCYRAKIKNINGAILVPQFNKHRENIVEFIAPFYLRKKLKLNDGDKIKIEITITK